MILVDDRDGSKELFRPLKAAGLPVELTRLHSADLAFEGKGEAGKIVSIGIEHKRLDARSNDIIQSLRDGRLSGEQLPKMLGENGSYDYGWLIVQGQWRTNALGQLTVYKGPLRGWCVVPGKMTGDELEKQLLTLDICGGLRVRYCETQAASIRYVETLYRWWTDRALDEHTSHLAVHAPHSLVALSDFRKAVCQWPGIGVRVSKAVEEHFEGSLRRAANANAVEWSDIQTFDRKGGSKRLGMSTATRIVDFLKGA